MVPKACSSSPVERGIAGQQLIQHPEPFLGEGAGLPAFRLVHLA
jgi:hypothetical protein